MREHVATPILYLASHPCYPCGELALSFLFFAPQVLAAEIRFDDRGLGMVTPGRCGYTRAAPPSRAGRARYDVDSRSGSYSA